MDVKINNDFNFDFIKSALENKKNFSWSRFGDGEFNCILGFHGYNCDWHNYYPDLGAALKNIILSKPEYFLSLQSMAWDQLHAIPLFQELIATRNNWVSHEVLHQLSIDGQIQRFFDVLKTREIVLVGNASLRGLEKFFPTRDFIEIPLKNCWLAFGETQARLSTTIRENDVVIYCASMMSNILIDGFQHWPITQMDVGSVFDPYVGRVTRNYHKALIEGLK
jgi:hypothetical protein